MACRVALPHCALSPLQFALGVSVCVGTISQLEGENSSSTAARIQLSKLKHYQLGALLNLIPIHEIDKTSALNPGQDEAIGHKDDALEGEEHGIGRGEECQPDKAAGGQDQDESPAAASTAANAKSIRKKTKRLQLVTADFAGPNEPSLFRVITIPS
ncbi:hypothetical protein EDD85DRAFT_798974 [Armillaria nabsnona]|nr:hypothetical protein EDD85DRAFT_798974 [Armillaria nabsnona]